MIGKCILSVLLLFLWTSACLANEPDGFVFRYGYDQNTTYMIVTSMWHTVSMTIDGKTGAVKDRLKQMHFPVKVVSLQALTTAITTGTSDEDGNISFQGAVTEHNIANTMDGLPFPSSQANLLKGMVMSGAFNEKTGKSKITSMKGGNLSSEITEETMSKFLGEVQEQITFPTNPIRRGDSFTQRFVTQFAVPGASPVSMAVVLTFTLSRIEPPVSYFDVSGDVDYKIEETDTKMSVNGKCIGSMRFDIKKQFPIDYVLNMNSHFTLDTVDQVINGEGTSNTRINYSVK
jgi:hypothetical protein